MVTRFDRLQRRRLGMLVAGFILVVSTSIAWAGSSGADTHREAAAQGTPVPLQFPTPTATAGPPTETATRTPTSEGRPFVEAISNDTNVRAGPDINDAPVGKIYPGRTYPVLGQRFDWYQIEFPDTPSGTAWVYSGVVTLTGDASLIVQFEQADIPTQDSAFVAAQETLAVITGTPGAIATLTAQVQITPTGVFTAAPGEEGPTLMPGQPLPTFTFPPYTSTPVIIPRVAPSSVQTDSDGLPPLVPILALGALGLLGLLISLLRRL
jgi:hypothetical protein